MEHEVPEAIRVAVCQLSGINRVSVESSPEFISDESSWAIQLRLTSTVTSDFVPKETHWVALVDGFYPAGRIRIYPANSGGIVHTFPHQDRNTKSQLSYCTWRTGKPCLDSPTQRLGRIAGGPEPKDDIEQRLRWHILRCLSWLEIAAENQLMVDGEPFEVPQCPDELCDNRFTVVHDEGSDTWQDWSERLGHYGEVRLRELPAFKKTMVADEFLDANGDKIRICRRLIRQNDKTRVGYWWLWPTPIVISPWHAPGTWDELRQVGTNIGVDVDRFIRWLSDRVGGKENVIVLLGYPIPEVWNGLQVEVHWQAILPPYVPLKFKPMRGFRKNPLGLKKRITQDFFNGREKIKYLKTANWHPDRLQARGGLSPELKKQSIAVIGVGALGSAIAEILARGGVDEILIIDGDVLKSGNLARHTLTGVDLGSKKAEALEARLQSIAPMSHFTALSAFLSSTDVIEAPLESFKIILDCTGEDSVLRNLYDAWWPIPRHFLSASLGYSANRLFLFSNHACCFPVEEYENAMRPWLSVERQEWSESGEKLEGAGCWSPVFPARNDDVWLAAVAIVKYLERWVVKEVRDGLHVFKKSLGQDIVGYQLVDQEESS